MPNEVTDDPKTQVEAFDLAMAWAKGQRSHWNQCCPDHELCAKLDTQEVIKWCAIAQCMSAMRLHDVIEDLERHK